MCDFLPGSYGVTLLLPAAGFGQALRAASLGSPPNAPSPSLALSYALADETPEDAPDGGRPGIEAPVVVPMTTMFPHSTTWPIWISGQANSIFQTHPNFHSPYAGINSFTGPFEYKVSLVGTLYTGPAGAGHPQAHGGAL